MGDLPLIGITMGDPSGIGPEIIVEALSEPGIFSLCRPLVLGDPGALSLVSGETAKTPLNLIHRPSDARGIPGQIDLIPLSCLDRDLCVPGKPCVEGGEAMVNYILEAVEMTQQGRLAAMVTCPISKALMQGAGYAYQGHTQLIAHLTRTKDYLMMLAGERLRVSLVTIHCALKDVPAILDEEKVYRAIAITAEALVRDFGISGPRLAVAALNPHGGEEGLFGSEEEAVIKPALRRAKNEGFHVEGPFPADTLFHRAVQGRYDAVVSMYHDQGLIPLKLLHFSDAVNITLGLPIVRTSVDHGTAYDIAGKGVADPSSLKAAIRLAARIAKNRADRGAADEQ